MSLTVDELDHRLELVAKTEPRIQALVAETDRRRRLHDELRAAPEGSLSGLLIGVKDILHARGLATRAGTGLPAELFAAEGDADCVAALRTAGALMLGKTVTTEFAYFEPGPTRNPHDPEHTPGGSSSGSAAAVAAGYCELALGTQTVGSVIRPAAFCGVVGFKPSYGRVPTGGLLLCSPSVDTIGLFARHVATVRRGAAVVVAGWDARAMEAALGGDTKPVLGVPDGPYLRQASPEGMPVFDEQVARLQAGGYRVERVEAMADIEAVNERHRALQAGEMAIEHGAWMDEHLNLYRQRTREILLRGREVPEGRLREARDGRAALRSRLHDAMDSAGIDLWISPSATGPAPRGIDSTGDPIMNLPWTHAGMPALSLPAGWVGRLPVGLQVVGRFGGDEEVIGWGKALCVLLG